MERIVSARSTSTAGRTGRTSSSHPRASSTAGGEGTVTIWTVGDLAEIIAAKPDILVVGTGYFGQMSVSEEARRYLGAQGIHVREARTRQAVADFNQLKTQRARIVAALHLTC